MSAGQVDALRTLSKHYGRSILAVAMRILSDQADAEEVAADVLWQAWREAGNFDPKRGSVGTWLVTLARSRAIDRLRARNARNIRMEPQPGGGEGGDPALELNWSERRKAVQEALANLKDGERILLQMAYFSDLSQSEIAARLGLPLGTVKTRIRNAMIKLRDALKGFGR